MADEDPFDAIRQMAAGYCLARSLHVAANMAIADQLDETSRSAAELAAAVGAHPDALDRMFGLPPFWATFAELEQSVRSGQPMGDQVISGGIWGYLARCRVRGDPEGDPGRGATGGYTDGHRGNGSR